MEQRTPEWFAARLNRVTASMVGAILGLSPYMNRNDAMRSMVRAREGAENEFTGNIATNWGTQNEAGALWDYEIETTHTVEQVGFVSVDDWAGASPDGFVGEYGLLEIKCPYGIRNDKPPVFKTLAEQPHYAAQIQFQLWATGRKWCHFWQWTPNGSKLERVERDEDWIAANIPALRQFWAEFMEEAADDHIGEMRITIDTPEAAKMVREWDELKEQEERAKERRADLLLEMIALCEERNAYFGGRKLTLTEKAGAVSYGKAINALLPDADLTAYTGKPSKSWGLR